MRGLWEGHKSMAYPKLKTTLITGGSEWCHRSQRCQRSHIAPVITQWHTFLLRLLQREERLLLFATYQIYGELSEPKIKDFLRSVRSGVCRQCESLLATNTRVAYQTSLHHCSYCIYIRIGGKVISHMTEMASDSASMLNCC